MTDGWILIHRKLQDNQIWLNNEPFDMRSAWIDLLMLTNHENVNTVFDGNPVEIKRGQYLTSIRKLSLRWGWGNEKTLKYLRLLESLQMIKRDSNNKRTLLTIENYDTYQNKPNTKRTQTERRPNADRAQTNNVKNVNNNIPPIIPHRYYPNDEKLDKAFSDFVEHRKKIKKPMSDKAVELAIKRLEKLSGGNSDKAVEIINQSILGGWQGLFELKDEGKSSKPNRINDFGQRKYDYSALENEAYGEET